jgi:hypothetical protein
MVRWTAPLSSSKPGVFERMRHHIKVSRTYTKKRKNEGWRRKRGKEREKYLSNDPYFLFSLLNLV